MTEIGAWQCPPHTRQTLSRKPTHHSSMQGSDQRLPEMRCRSSSSFWLLYRSASRSAHWSYVLTAPKVLSGRGSSLDGINLHPGFDYQLILITLYKKHHIMGPDEGDPSPFFLFLIVSANGHTENTPRESSHVLTTPGSSQATTPRAVEPPFTYPSRSWTRFLTTSTPTSPVSEVAPWSPNPGHIAAEDTSSAVWVLTTPSISWLGPGAYPQHPTVRTSTPESLRSPIATSRGCVTYYPSTPPPSFSTSSSSGTSGPLPLNTPAINKRSTTFPCLKRLAIFLVHCGPCPSVELSALPKR